MPDGVLTVCVCVCKCVCGTSTVHARGVNVSRAGFLEPSAPWGLSSPLAPTELPGKPGMEAVGLGVEGGGQCGSK